MNKPTLLQIVCILFVFSGATATIARAQDLTTLHTFSGSDGENPVAGLVHAADGSFYGATSEGGAYGSGTVFKITLSGTRSTLTTLYSFCFQKNCTDGDSPQADLVQASDGNFYGTTAEGGANDSSMCGEFGCGTVFKITPSGTLTTLYSFCSQKKCTDGFDPEGLAQGTDGDFYGTTHFGGTGIGVLGGGGTVFKITPSGMLTTLYTFCPDVHHCTGIGPDAGLVQGADGNFYGTTYGGGDGAYGSGGTVFKITPSGTLTTLYSFCSKKNCVDGKGPQGVLVQGIDGNFYGTTVEGGDTKCGSPRGCGTVFKITPSGTLTPLYSFSGGADGGRLLAGLIQAADGNFYGTTSAGGSADGGTVFEITPSGTLTTLYNFCSDPPVCTDGQTPTAALVQGTGGGFYGTTWLGGSQGDGTVFRLHVRP